MSVVSRLAHKLPSVKALDEYAQRVTAHREELLRQVEELCRQRDTLERERDELSAHCRRQGEEIGEANERLRSVMAEREAILHDRDALERERDELRSHCERLEGDLAQRRASEGALRSQLASLDQLHQDFVRRAMQLIGADALAGQMQREWDERAQQNAMHFTNSDRDDWSEAEYAATGEKNIRDFIANDMENICQGTGPAAMKIVEIGCGAGRMTKALAKLFGEVHAVDISAEMIRIAGERLAGVPNVVLHHNNGMDLRALPSAEFDFALSFIVFQHIPSKTVIEGYVREVHRVLKPGRLFKFQVQGGNFRNVQPLSTWLGVSYTRDEMDQLAGRNGFEMRYAHGEGTQDFWVWFFKRESCPEGTRRSQETE